LVSFLQKGITWDMGRKGKVIWVSARVAFFQTVLFQTVPQIQIISDKDDLRILDINNRLSDFFDMGSEAVSGQSMKAGLSCELS